jgi:hypothetical protein
MRRTGYEPRANSRWCHTGTQALAALLLVAATAGCVSTGSPATPNPPDQPLTTTHPAASSTPTTRLGRGDDRLRSTGSSTSISGGWTFTTYYTAVQSFHSSAPKPVRGCMQRECDHGNELLGSFPRDFVQAVEDEGTGRITDGPHRGKYLNWSYDTGFWLDSDPVDTDGRRLLPYVTAAADSEGLPKRARFQIVRCGREQEDGSAIDVHVCARLKASTWVVLDAFTPGLGGRRHIDLYIGEEDRVRFPDTSSSSITTRGSAIRRVG